MGDRAPAVDQVGAVAEAELDKVGVRDHREHGLVGRADKGDAARPEQGRQPVTGDLCRHLRLLQGRHGRDGLRQLVRSGASPGRAARRVLTERFPFMFSDDIFTGTVQQYPEGRPTRGRHGDRSARVPRASP